MKYEGAGRGEEGGAEGEGREGWGTREGRGGMRDRALGRPALSRPHAVAEATWQARRASFLHVSCYPATRLLASLLSLSLSPPERSSQIAVGPNPPCDLRAEEGAG